MKIIKVSAVLMAVLMMLFALVGCANNPATVSSSQPSGSANAQVSQAAATVQASQSAIQTAGQAKSDLKVGLIIATSGLGDKSINDQANAGLTKAASDFGIQTKLMQPTDASQFLNMEQTLAESGYQMIINDSFDQADAVTKAADQYKDVQFVIIDTVVNKPNVLSATYATNECSFLAGAAAALASKTGTVGFVGGMSIPTIQEFEAGYEQGAKYVNPNIKVLVKYIGNDNTVWADAPKAKALTLDLANNGADVVFQAAGGSGLGVIDGCKEKNIWAIGVNVDQESVAPATVLTSALTSGDVAIYQAIQSYMKNPTVGSLGTSLVMNLKNNGVGLVMSKNLTDDQKSKINAIKQDVIDGKIKVVDVEAASASASAS